MNKFFYYYNPVCTGINTPTVFGNDPYVTAIKEMFVSELQQMSYYIQKLQEMNIDMELYTDKVIEFISVLIVNLDFKKESFFIIIEDLYNNKIMLKKMYISACTKAEVMPDILQDNPENLSSKDVILKILNEKEKNSVFRQNKDKLTVTRKYLYEIIIRLVLNACDSLIELKNYNINFEEGKKQVLNLLNTANYPSLTDDEIIEKIMDFSKYNYEISRFLYKSEIENFGPVISSEIKNNRRKGKAILVSGKSYGDLDKILKSVEGLNIFVYTHNAMVSAFLYDKLCNHPNLIGHYQNFHNNYSLDFASFPGPIYLSGNSNPKIDVIRGQIYSSAKYPSFGIAKIENKDFTPVIRYALESDGFENDFDGEKLISGCSEADIEKNLGIIYGKFINKEIKRIIIIGVSDNFNNENEFIINYINNSDDSDYIISFCKNSDRNNFWYISPFINFAILYKITEKLKENIPECEKHISVIFADCNTSTISHIFNLIHLNIEDIFLGPCCPNIINPMLIDGLGKLFKIKQYNQELYNSDVL